MNTLKTAKHFLLCGVIGLSLISCNNENQNKIDESAEEVKTATTEVVNKTKSALKNDYSESNSSVLNETQVDSKAMFGDCATAECSEDKILSFIKNNIIIPNDTDLLDNSLEQVMVVVNANGTIGDVKFVASGNKKGCPACQQAAVDVVGKMQNWKPAMKDGKPVAVKMTIPVRFKNS